MAFIIIYYMNEYNLKVLFYRLKRVVAYNPKILSTRPYDIQLGIFLNY